MRSNFLSQNLFLNRVSPRTGLFGALLPAVLAMVMFWPFGGGKKVQMMSGTVTPGAQGTVTVHTSGNNNVKLDIKVKNLANPASLTPPENVYVLWVQPPGQPPQNQAEIKVNGDENGGLNTETSFKRFKVFITGEQNAQVQQPQGPQVLSADVAQG